MKIRIAEQTWTELASALLARTDVETAGILLGEPLETASGFVVAVREAFAVPDHSYRIRRIDQLSIDPVAFNRMVRPARDRGWSVLTIHTHPGAREPWFSHADDAGDRKLMPALRVQTPHAPHGSLVVTSRESAIARISNHRNEFDAASLRVVGRTISTLGNQALQREEWFARQALALGAWGQAQLRGLRVGIVGLGGIGSLVAMQLAHLGVGAVVLLDGDLIELSNVSRITGATTADVGSHKVDVVARYITSLGFGTSVDAYRRYLDPAGLALLGDCDVVLSCVDRHSPRALLNRLSYSHYVPAIDMGTAFRVNECGQIIDDAGRVVVIGPGRPCLACWGHIDPSALRVEALPAEDRERELGEGYIQGANEPQPSVIAFNAMVAGSGVIELLRMVTGFAGHEDPPARLAFSFREGMVRRNRLAGRAHCSICSPTTPRS